MKATYIGHEDGCYVPALDLDVQFKEIIDVADVDLFVGLCAQEANWRPHGEESGSYLEEFCQYVADVQAENAPPVVVSLATEQRTRVFEGADGEEIVLTEPPASIGEEGPELVIVPAGTPIDAPGDPVDAPLAGTGEGIAPDEDGDRAEVQAGSRRETKKERDERLANEAAAAAESTGE